MRKSKLWLTTTYSVLLAAGLFCAQVCQVVCAAAACASETQAAQPEPGLEHAPCHQSKNSPADKSPAESLPASLPAAPDQPHDCQQHPVLQSLPPDNPLAKTGPPLVWQMAGNAALLVVKAEHAPAAPYPLAQSLFRPPPRSWLTTVQRI